jgi:hypothetical protein
MRSIVYYTTAVHAMSEEEFVALGRECTLRDSHLGVTRMLLQKNEECLQVIEGSKGVTNDMYASILADPRYTIAGKISDRIIGRREFEGSAMRFKSLNGAPTGTPFLKPFSYEAFRADPDLALLVLAFFFRNRCGEPVQTESSLSETLSLV